MPLPQNPNTFANNPLDRASANRLDEAWLAGKLQDAESMIVPLWGLKPMVLPPEKEGGLADIGWLRSGMMATLLGQNPIIVLLGLDAQDRARFAVDISHMADPANEGPLAGFGEFAELREIAASLHEEDAAMLAQAKSMIDWHRRHTYCANCGARTELAEAGYKRECKECKSEHFPRTDPVVISLVVKGDRCLLGRGPHFPEKMFSALAGFVEPGESIEEAVAREIKEEVGIDVGIVHYHSTQPWPYPSSLMIGCIAEAETEEIVVDKTEIAEAQWFTRDELKAALNGNAERLWVPPRFAIAHQLVKTWAESE